MQRSYLRNMRIKHGLTAKQVAKEVGIEEDHMTRIERGVRNPSLKVACKLERFFGIPVCELLKRDGEDDED